MRNKDSLNYPTEQYLRAMYWQIVASARFDFSQSASYATAIAKAATNTREYRESTDL